ncbi:MAG: POTRA domain-containing protein [Candidatus Omnitrophica bacterium]|nr:POTRA domain-containing protein [Candidatus Omnitrophota bacterium]MDD5236492.1 POTRA domain-containing protein [Candidatus Omnitrophota bacterium]MDD5610622.1 POTRA domain-containing protein [Candidatus Omnitrophota bacterium]
MKNIVKHSVFLLTLSISFFGLEAASFAQPIPSAVKTGAVQQQIESAPAYRGRPATEQEVLFQIEKPEKEITLPEGIKAFIKEISFSGNTVVSTPELKRITAKYEGRELSFKDMKEMTKALENEYHSQGYFLASAYLPEQDIKGGVLKVVILEGRLGKVLIKDYKYYNPEFIRKHFHPAKYGVIHYGRFIKSLMLLNEGSDCEARATLIRSKQPGATDIVISIKDKLPLHLYYAFNNFGSRYISEGRNDVSANYTNLVAAGDTMALRTVFGDPFNRLKFARGEYGFFVNSYGTKLKFSYDWLEFDAIRELKPLGSSGLSKIYGTELVHPVIRNRNTSMDAGIGFDYKSVYDFLAEGLGNSDIDPGGRIVSDDELRVFKAKFKFDHLDNFSGRSYLLGMVSVGVPGIMGGLKKNDIRSSRYFGNGKGAGGNFTKINLAFVRVQKMPFSSYLIFKADGQYASDDLTVPEQLAIGGADSVRGYPQSEYLGDQGFETSLELRVPPPLVGNVKIPFTKRKIKDIVQIIGFVDYAGVYFKHYDSSFGERRAHQLLGAGTGLRLNFPGDITGRIDLGFPLAKTRPTDAAETHIYFEISKKFL